MTEKLKWRGRLLVGLLAGCMALAGCGGEAARAGSSEEEITRVVFEEGERFAGYAVEDGMGNAVSIEALPGENRMVFYLSRTCGDCVSEYDGYQYLASILEGGPVAVSYLWQTALPEEDEVPLLDRRQFYLVGTDLRLGDWVPTYFSLDSDGTILFKSIELEEVAAYLAEALPKGEREGLLADYLAREKIVALLAEEEPGPDELAALERAVQSEGYAKALVVGAERDLQWADYCDAAGLFRTLGGLERGGGPLYLWEEGGALTCSGNPPV